MQTVEQPRPEVHQVCLSLNGEAPLAGSDHSLRNNRLRRDGQKTYFKHLQITKLHHICILRDCIASTKEHSLKGKK